MCIHIQWIVVVSSSLRLLFVFGGLVTFSLENPLLDTFFFLSYSSLTLGENILSSIDFKHVRRLIATLTYFPTQPSAIVDWRRVYVLFTFTQRRLGPMTARLRYEIRSNAKNSMEFQYDVFGELLLIHHQVEAAEKWSAEDVCLCWKARIKSNNVYNLIPSSACEE